jgi:hypothetical protein
VFKNNEKYHPQSEITSNSSNPIKTEKYFFLLEKQIMQINNKTRARWVEAQWVDVLL